MMLEALAVFAVMIAANLVGVWAGRRSRVTADAMDLELARAHIRALEAVIRRAHAAFDDTPVVRIPESRRVVDGTMDP